MITKEQVLEKIEALDESELQRVAEYLEFLRFRQRVRHIPVCDAAQRAALRTQFAAEDREMAETGMSDFAEGLAKEDAQ